MRYIDDIILVVKQSDLEKIYSEFNNQEERLKFTLEMPSFNENYNQTGISFLDKFLYIKENKIISRWYIKPTSSNLIMSYNSIGANQVKKAVVTGKIWTVITSNNTVEGENLDLCILKNLLLRNHWPEFVINGIFKRNIKNIRENRNSRYYRIGNNEPAKIESNFQIKLKDTNSIIVKVPFQNVLVENYIKDLKKYLKKNLPQLFVHFVYITKNIKSVVDRIQLEKPEIKNACGTIYKFECICKESYIGQTDCYFKNRQKQHFNGKESSIYQHINGCEEYKIDRNLSKNSLPIKDRDFIYFHNRFSVLAYEQNTSLRKIKEAILIKAHNTSLNNQKKDFNKKLVNLW